MNRSVWWWWWLISTANLLVAAVVVTLASRHDVWPLQASPELPVTQFVHVVMQQVAFLMHKALVDTLWCGAAVSFQAWVACELANWQLRVRERREAKRWWRNHCVDVLRGFTVGR